MAHFLLTAAEARPNPFIEHLPRKPLHAFWPAAHVKRSAAKADTFPTPSFSGVSEAICDEFRLQPDQSPMLAARIDR